MTLKTEISTNWTYHHKGRCFRCQCKTKLNRFGLCLRCYKVVSQGCLEPEYVVHLNSHYQVSSNMPQETSGP